MGTASTNHLFVVILAGGGGTRLWPRSTNAKPKQFLRLFSDKTLIQETKKWSAHALPSIDEPQKISGAMAELLCKASVIARQWESRRAMA